jgi:hypothetical protein
MFTWIELHLSSVAAINILSDSGCVVKTRDGCTQKVKIISGEYSHRK